MAKEFEILFEKSGAKFTAQLLEKEAPITCENFWEGIAKPHRETITHGSETGPELWCFVPKPKEDLPFENSTVFPEPGEIVFYHYRQPPKRDGIDVWDIGIYWDCGQSRLVQGWMPANLFARITGKEQLERLRREAGRLLVEGSGTVVISRKT